MSEVLVYCLSGFMMNSAVFLQLAFLALFAGAGAAPSSVQPDWFQTTVDLYAGTELQCFLGYFSSYQVELTSGLVTGPTATGAAPFLAQTNPAPSLPNLPMQTSEPISGANRRNIFHLMGNQRYLLVTKGVPYMV